MPETYTVPLATSQATLGLVMSTSVATRRIRNGQIITVDGTAGTVTC